MPYVNVRQLYSKAGAAREAGFCGPYAEDDPRRRPPFNPPVPPPPPVRGWGVIAYNIDASWLNWSAGCLSEDEASDRAFGWADGRWHFELPEDGIWYNAGYRTYLALAQGDDGGFGLGWGDHVSSAKRRAHRACRRNCGQPGAVTLVFHTEGNGHNLAT